MSKAKSIRLGFLIPPGNPNSEPEIIQMQHPDVSVHFTRMVARGTTGGLDGQEARNQSQIDHLPENIELLSLVKPSVIALTHTATSYTLGIEKESKLVSEMEQTFGIPLITAFGSVVQALHQMRVKKISFGTPYNLNSTLQCKQLLEAYGFEIVQFGRLEGVQNIYDETSARALELAYQVNHPDAQAIFLSGVGMPTIDILPEAEKKVGKPVISSVAATMWRALKVSQVNSGVAGFGSLLERKYDE
jgi:maleate cis-trans isomerase